MKIQELIENKQEHFTNKLLEDVEESLWAAISIKS
jgi:hypothetical protein